jgi:hypothetical protein
MKLREASHRPAKNMKLNSSPDLTGNRPVVRAAFWCGCAGLLAAALLSAGCHKAADTSSAPPPAPPAPVAAAPDTNQDTQAGAQAQESVQNQNQSPPPASAPPADNPNSMPMVTASGEPNLSGLDTALMGWLVANRRRPSSFAEFAATAGVAIPRPPPGKTYVITPSMHVRLVDLPNH